MGKKAEMTSPIGNRRSGHFSSRGVPIRKWVGLAGLTLIEILISVVILATASVLIMQALVRGAYALEVAHRRTQAYTFSSVKMADLEMSLQRGQEPKTHGEFRMDHTPFEWDVQMMPLADEPQLQLVTLTVGWRQGRNDYSSQVSTVAKMPDVAAEP